MPRTLTARRPLPLIVLSLLFLVACSSRATSTPESASTDAGHPPAAQPSPITLPLDGTKVEGAYTMPIAVGTPPRTFDVVIDTGSANLNLLGDAALCSTCGQEAGLARYDPSTSSSGSIEREAFTVHYGKGSLEARKATDQVAVGGLSPIAYDFGVITEDAGIQNILGLAYEAVAQPEGRALEPYFDALVRASGLADGFALQLCRGAGSSITLGTTEEGTSAIVVPIAEERWYVIDGKRLETADGTDLGRFSVPVVVDSGTTELMLPSDVHAALVKALAPVAARNGLDLSDPFVATKASVIAQFPTLHVVAEGADRGEVTLAIGPERYFRPAGPDGFLFSVGVDDQQVLLGQPLFLGYRVLFDRAGKRLVFSASGCE